MKTNLKLTVLLAIVFCLISSSGWAANTWYVRQNGGTVAQCTGLVDQDYDGGIHGTSCALNHPFLVTSVDDNCGGSSGAVKWAGGDTMIIYPKVGGYDMGYGASGTAGSSSFPWDCHMRDIPSGSDSSHKTKIYGSNYSSCSSISSSTELYGKERSYWVIQMLGSDNVDLRCLHVTDHSDCRYNSTINDGDACPTSYPYGDFAQKGLKSADSDNVNIEDLWITGMASEGASISTPSNWTARNWNLWGNSYININFNGYGNSGTVDAATGTMDFTDGTIAWSGCTLVYPPTSSSYNGITLYDPKRCCSQDQGCAADGVGSNENDANWSFTGTKFIHNVADGLDLLYHDIDGGSGTITVSNVKSIGNSGNQIKTGGNAVIKNTAVDADCNYFRNKSYTWEYSGNCRTWDSTDVSTCETGHAGCEWDGGVSQCLNFSDHCRASGNAFSFAYQTNTDVYVEGVSVVNTVNAEPFNISARNIANCAANNLLTVKNSVITTTNSLNYINIDSSCSSATVAQDHSVIYGFTSNPTGTGNVFTNPNLSGTILGSSANFLIPNTSSSAYDIADETASHQGSLDLFNYNRGASWDAGAIEFGSTDTGGSGGGSTTPTTSMGGVKIKLGGGKISQ